MKLIIAEKPSVAREIASALGIVKKNTGYLENEKYFVTWAFGHLIQICGPEAYGFKSWSKENLPIIPDVFKFQPKQVKTESGYQDDPGAHQQLMIIADLFKRAESIIVATDAGREGELIFRLIYSFLGSQKPFQRLWISSLTEKAILEGFKSLKNGSDYDSLYHSALCRAESDWLIGINATQSITLATGNKSLISLGRVQTPTLALICQRYIENTSFKSVPFFLVRILLEKDSSSFFATAIKNDAIHHFENAEEANKLVQFVKNKIAVVDSIEEEKSKEPPPLLYDLSTLQQDANKRYGFTADQTLTLAQQLYENKLITYPRTGSRYISEDVFDTVPDLIDSISQYPPLANAAKSLIGKKLNQRSVNGDKVTDHHALLPTGNLPGRLTEEHTVVYDLVVARMLEAFSDYCHKLITNVLFSIQQCQYHFTANAVLIIEHGWRSVLNLPDENADEQSLPVLQTLETLPVKDSISVAQKTKPKPLYTEGSLLKAMETCGKEIEDEQLRSAMKECGLGTPATRASIIETLFTRQFIERQKKSLVPTTKGLAVYDLVKDQKIAHPVLTGEWEKKLEDIRSKNISESSFMNEIKDYTAELTSELLSSGSAANTGAFVNGASRFVCPKCGKGSVVIRDKAAGCSEYKNGCDFTIWRTIADKKISESNIYSLLQKKKTTLIKGFISKAKKPFDAYLILNELHKVEFEFAKTQKHT